MRQPEKHNNPVVVIVNDNWAQLDQMRTRLRSRYADNCAVFGVPDGDKALRLLSALEASGREVAVLVADEQMYPVSGREIAQAVKRQSPDVKTMLLTPNSGLVQAEATTPNNGIDVFHPKQGAEALDRAVDDLVRDWHSEKVGPGVTLVGTLRSQFDHADFLTRNRVPHQKLDVAHPDTQALLLERGITYTGEPLILLDDGTKLRSPTVDELADSLGFPTQAKETDYDLVIIGGGPAGLSSAVYGASEGLRTVVIERQAPGGQAGQSSEIANYFGFRGGIAGAELADRGRLQAQDLGAEFVYPAEVEKLEVDGDRRCVVLDDGTRISARSVIIATGLEQRPLGIEGADELTGNGVYYGAAMSAAATCDGATAVVVGGANSAGQAALHLSQTADKVVMLIRGDSLEAKMSDYLVKRIENRRNIEVRLQSEVLEVHGGDNGLDQVTIRNGDSKETMEAAGLFVFIGARPQTQWLDGVVERDAKGYILTEQMISAPVTLADGSTRERFRQETSVPGVFAVGDSAAGAVNRVATAVGRGAEAVDGVHNVLALQPHTPDVGKVLPNQERQQSALDHSIGMAL